MQIKIFDVTSVSLEELDALNRFLRSHRRFDPSIGFLLSPRG